ncbi:hypothetical protein FS837_008278 [Tulasnella sp. UAMH 9824]|nr:hypothetical protein FS837_008278 [Tulasnella sp. UAMH 9824]
MPAKGGWNKVVFNFPHAGAGITDQGRNILTNQRLLFGFLRSVAPALSKGVPPKELLLEKPRADSDDERGETTPSTSVSTKADADDPIESDEEEFGDGDEFTGVLPASDSDDAAPIDPFQFYFTKRPRQMSRRTECSLSPSIPDSIRMMLESYVGAERYVSVDALPTQAA